MYAKFGLCQGCGSQESRDCQLYICKDKDGFVVVACMVYVINHSMAILDYFDLPPMDEED